MKAINSDKQIAAQTRKLLIERDTNTINKIKQTHKVNKTLSSCEPGSSGNQPSIDPTSNQSKVIKIKKKDIIFKKTIEFTNLSLDEDPEIVKDNNKLKLPMSPQLKSNPSKMSKITNATKNSFLSPQMKSKKGTLDTFEPLNFVNTSC